jgi:hypothetical protein
MKCRKLLALCNTLDLLTIPAEAAVAAAASSSQPSLSHFLDPPSNFTDAPAPLQTLSYNGSVSFVRHPNQIDPSSRSNYVRFRIPNSNIALDFDQQRPFIEAEHVLMCLVTALAEIFGQPPTQTLPDSRNFYYRSTFVHIQDLDPTPGRMHTYRDMVTTLRGVGEYMVRYDKFMNPQFWIWDVSTPQQVKIGLGALADNPYLQAHQPSHIS